MKLKEFKNIIEDLVVNLTEEELNNTEIYFSLYNENENEGYTELKIFGESRDLYDDKAVIYIDFDTFKEVE